MSSVGGGSIFNKGTLDAYRKIVCREMLIESSSSVPGRSGSLTVYGIISGAQFQGVSGTGIGDMLKSEFATSGSKTVDHAVDSDNLEGLNLATVRTHSPASHSATHTSGSSDAVEIYGNQIIDLNTWNLIGPILIVTGSNVSYISGSLIVTGSLGITGSFTTNNNITADGVISGSSFQGPISKSQLTDFNNYTLIAPQFIITGSGAVTSWITGSLKVSDYISGADIYGRTMRVRTGSGTTTYQRQRINFVNAGNMIITMNDSAANDEIVINLQATGSGGGATLFADYVSSSNVYNQAALVGTDSSMVARADHVHGTPGLYDTAPADISGSSYSGSSASGSHGDHTHRGVLSLAASGSSDLYSRTYLTGSTPNINVTQSGQVLAVALGTSLSGLSNLYSTNLSGSYISGSNFTGSNFRGTNAVFTNISGSQFSGSTFSGSTFTGSAFIGNTVTTINVKTTNLSGSGTISGSTLLGSTLKVPTIYAEFVSGSYISGSVFSGSLSNITTIAATNISGSNISGSVYTGSSAYITNVYVTNLSGSGNISGSHIGYGNFASVVSPYISGSVSISGSKIVADSGIITTLDCDYLTGSIMVSGSEFRFGSGWASWISGSNISGSHYLGKDIQIQYITSSAVITGASLQGNLNSSYITGSTISGSTYQGNLVSSISKSGSAAIVGNATLEQGSSITLTQNGNNIKFDVSSPVDPYNSVISEIIFGQTADAGLTSYYSRGDHTHGTPSLTANLPKDISGSASAGLSNEAGRYDHTHRGVLSLSNSGSTDLYSRIYLTSSGAVSITQNGQVIILSGSTGTGSGGGGVTGKSGYAYIASGDTIAHGLGYMPTWASVHASGSIPAYFSYIFDATNLTVYHTVGGSLGVFWKVE